MPRSTALNYEDQHAKLGARPGPLGHGQFVTTADNCNKLQEELHLEEFEELEDDALEEEG